MGCRGCGSNDGCSCSITGDLEDIITVTGGGTVISPYEILFDGEAWLATLPVDDSTDFYHMTTVVNPRLPMLTNTHVAKKIPLPTIGQIIPVGGIDGAALLKASGANYDLTWDTLTVPVGAAGAPGVGGGHPLTMLTSTTQQNPGAGNCIFNNLTMASVTQVYLPLVDTSDRAITLSAIDHIFGLRKGRLRFQSITAPERWAEYDVISRDTSVSTYTAVTVAYLGGSGVFKISASDTMMVYIASGDTGIGQPWDLTFPLGTETGTLTNDAASARYRLPYDVYLNAGHSGARASVQTAGTMDTTIQIWFQGPTDTVPSQLCTVLIDATEKTSTTAATAPTIASRWLLCDTIVWATPTNTTEILNAVGGKVTLKGVI